MYPGPDLLRRHERALGEGAHTGQAVRVLLVGPALGERGVQQRADGLRVVTLCVVAGDAAQCRVHGEPPDAVLAHAGAQYAGRGQPQMGQPFAVCGGERLGELADELVCLVRLQGPAVSSSLSGVASGSHSWTT